MDDQHTTYERRGIRGQREARPRIRPPRSAAERVCLLVSALGLIATVGITAYWWSALPATIATHFDISGAPNSYGPKATVLFLPVLLLALTLSFTILARYPWIFNYPVVITQENAARQYRRGRMLLASVNAVMAVVLAAIQWQTIQLARGATNLTFTINLAVIIVLILLIPFVAIGLIVWWVTHSA